MQKKKIELVNRFQDIEFFEDVLLKLLFTDPKIRDKCLQFVFTYDVFQKNLNKLIVNVVRDLINKYGGYPTAKEVVAVLENDLAKEHFKNVLNICLTEDEIRQDFLIPELEKFFKKQMVLDVAGNILNEVVDESVLDSNKVERLKDAYAFNFDDNVGMDIFSANEEMYDFYHNKSKYVPSTITNFDRLIQGGFPNKTLTLFMAGCVTKNTSVEILIDNMWGFSGTCHISSIETFINKGFKVLVNSPDGYVPVKQYVEKGFKNCYAIAGYYGGLNVTASDDHLFETDVGWVFNKDLDPKIHRLLTINGYEEFVKEYAGVFDVVDIEVDHENHRYYTNGISSHNTNVGKSLVMTSLAVSNVYDNKKVLYVSCEMSTCKIGERILGNVFDVPISDLPRMSQSEFNERYSRVSNYKNTLILREYPPKSINSNHIRHLLNELRLKKKFTPDVVYVDYLALMTPIAPYKGQQKHEALQIVAEELRAVAVEFEMPIVSAVQVGRDGLNSTDIDMEDISESIGITFTADVMVAVTQSPELKEAGKYCWTIIKNRYGMNKIYITVLVDFEKMRVSYDEENDKYATPDGKPKAPKTSIENKQLDDDATEIIKSVVNKKEKEDFFDFE